MGGLLSGPRLKSEQGTLQALLGSFASARTLLREAVADLERRSPVLHLIQKIRDESHRFAVSYHRKRREMRDRESELDQISGVGPRTRQRLLEHFGSIRALRTASPDALTAVVSPAVAAKIRNYFEGEPEPTALPILN